MLGFDVGTARKVWTAALLALLFFVIYVASTTVLVIVFAVFFSYLIYPMVALVERVRPRRVPRVASIALVFVVVVALLAVVGSLFGVQLQDQATRLLSQLPALMRTDVPNRLPLPHFLEPLRERIVDFVRSQIETGSDKAVPVARSLGLGVVHAASNLIYLVLIPILSFLLIKDGAQMRDAFLALLNRRHRVLWSDIVDDVNVLLSKYVRAMLFLSLATLLCYGVAFSLLGVPYAFLLAVSAGLLEFVPFAGPLAAVAITLVVAVFSSYPSAVAGGVHRPVPALPGLRAQSLSDERRGRGQSVPRDRRPARRRSARRRGGDFSRGAGDRDAEDRGRAGAGFLRDIAR